MFLILMAIGAFLVWCLIAPWTRILQALLVILCLPVATIAVLWLGAIMAGQAIGVLARLVR